MTVDQEKVWIYLLSWKEKNKDKKFPSFSEISINTGIDNSLLPGILNELKSNVALQEKAILKRNYAQYCIELNNNENVLKKYRVIDKYVLFKALIIVFSLIGLVLSIYYNVYSFDTKQITVKSCVCAVFFICFAVIIFEAVVIFYQLKYFFLCCLFSFLWFVILLFNMLNIMAGQHNFYIQTNIKKNVIDTVLNNNIIYTNLTNELNDKINELHIYEKERKKLFDLSADTYSKRVYLNKYEKIINKLSIEIDKTRQEQNEFIKNNKVFKRLDKEYDFIEYISSVLKINANKFTIILYLIRAVLLDIISSVGFALAFFLKIENKEI